MTLSQLDYFLSVGQTLSVSQTAKEMYVSQSAVSKQIILLEKELGITLFSRIGNTMELTEGGHKLWSCLQRCKSDFSATCSNIVSQKSMEISLAFTASLNIGDALLDIAAWLRTQSALHLVIEALNYQNQITSNTDMIITYEDVKLSSTMNRIPLFTINKYIAFSKDDPFYGKPDLCPGDFNQRTLFMGSIHRENYRLQMDLCQRLRLNPPVSSRGNIASLLLATISEHGFCIMDELCKEIHTPGLALLPIDEKVDVILAWDSRADERIHSISREIADLLLQWYSNTKLSIS